jgi:hypothetical protein
MGLKMGYTQMAMLRGTFWNIMVNHQMWGFMFRSSFSDLPDGRQTFPQFWNNVARFFKDKPNSCSDLPDNGWDGLCLESDQIQLEADVLHLLLSVHNS